MISFVRISLLYCATYCEHAVFFRPAVHVIFPFVLLSNLKWNIRACSLPMPFNLVLSLKNQHAALAELIKHI